ncbi:hypothetical protein ABRZ10_07130 [Castellaniella ginsengisoli]|uniref:Uncharacterized protein n=1 Tax=Castellaniella ginsengisoli TaxID=546114 RepID=A0AB39DWT2_9BURK
MSQGVIPNSELAALFEGTDFGGLDHRKLLESSVLKKAMGYHCGHTITTIMKDMGLINADGKVLRRGQMVLREAYGHLTTNGGDSMTKATMLEPVAYRSKESPYLFSLGGPEADGFDGLITTTQAEAYAAARARVALEAAEEAVVTLYEADEPPFLLDITRAIRALLPSTPARPESEQ